jgi:GT2 family glycosyltransferase
VNTFAPLHRDVLISQAIPVGPPLDGVSVISVAYMTGPTLFEHIDSVLAEPLASELILIDNGSEPADAQRLREIAAGEPRLRLYQGNGNVGFARACNTGAEYARARALLFLNPDAVLLPGTVQALLEARASRSKGPVVVGGRLCNPDGSEQRGGRRGEVTPVSTFMTLSRLAARVKRLDHYEIHREHDPVPTECVALPTISGACFLMTRADYFGVGGFDTGYFLHVEDIDLCWRVRRRGGEVVYHPSAAVVHYGHTSMTEPVFVEYWKGRGLARYFRKRADGPGAKFVAWVFGPFIVAASLARVVLTRART